MPNIEPATALFTEANPDYYLLTSEEDFALEAAWSVLKTLEWNRQGSHKFYGEESKESTFDYLRSGGEERPISGIFAIELLQSRKTTGEIDLHVSNRNGLGDETYRAMLRTAVEVVGVI